MLLTWSLTFWFLFTGLFFTLKSPYLAPKKWVFLINFIRILWFIWDLGLVLFDSHKDSVSGKILVFSNILGLLEENWAQKLTKTINFGYILFPLKHLILKDCSEAVCLIKTYLWLKFQQTRVIFAGERAQKPPPKETISWMLHHHENIWKFITWQPQMLH